jgi:hypothetical protein
MTKQSFAQGDLHHARHLAEAEFVSERGAVTAAR